MVSKIQLSNFISNKKKVPGLGGLNQSSNQTIKNETLCLESIDFHVISHSPASNVVGSIDDCGVEASSGQSIGNVAG